MNPDATQAVLLLPRLRVQNANCVSSPLTWGFPAPSAFTGFVHALERQLRAEGLDLRAQGVGIVCHQFEPQVFQPPGKRTHVFSLTRNPVDQTGSTAAIVEEGRAHMEISLVIGWSGEAVLGTAQSLQQLSTHMQTVAEGMRLAGGSMLPTPSDARHRADLRIWPEDFESQDKAFKALRRRLLPGFALVSRADLLAYHLAVLQSAISETTAASVDALDALLDLCALHIEPPAPDAVQGPRWTARRAQSGWLVPLPVGYAAISELYTPGQVRQVRDATVPFRFVESVLSLGQWLGPHRLKTLSHLLWFHQARPDAGLYELVNRYLPPVPLTAEL